MITNSNKRSKNCRYQRLRISKHFGLYYMGVTVE
jgi:hypothetical protein